MGAAPALFHMICFWNILLSVILRFTPTETTGCFGFIISCCSVSNRWRHCSSSWLLPLDCSVLVGYPKIIISKTRTDRRGPLADGLWFEMQCSVPRILCGNFVNSRIYCTESCTVLTCPYPRHLHTIFRTSESVLLQWNSIPNSHLPQCTIP